MKPSVAIWSCILGVIFAFVAGYINDFFTSRNHKPVKYCSRNTVAGSAPTILGGFVLGHVSGLIPILMFIVIIYVSWIIGEDAGLVFLSFGLLGFVPILIVLLALWPIYHGALNIVKVT